MASIKFGNIVVAMAGKISGNVYSRNKGGAYSRTWVKPVNPQSSAQLGVRNFLTSLSQAWRGLTQANRDAWSAAAENFKRINRMADTIKLTGNALYVSLNKNLADIGVSAITTPPQPTEVGYITALSVVADNSSNSLVATFTAVNDTNVAYKVFATGALSAGINSPGTKYRQIGYSGTAQASPYTISTPYNNTFGAVGAVGSKIFVKIVPVDISTGQMGSPIEAVAVIQA
jgi:hypothetical protein